MCLIIASSTGKPIPAEYIEDAASSNRDGCGVAWFHEGQVHWHKGLDADGSIAALKDEMPANCPHVFHARISTVGGNPDELTHPFPITKHAELDLTGSTDRVLFHNGMFSDWKTTVMKSMLAAGIKVPTGLHWSDTRAMALLCHIHGPNIIAFLDTTSRYLVFDATAPAKERMKLWGSWHSHEEFKFSNQGSCALRSSFRRPAANGTTGNNTTQNSSQTQTAHTTAPTATTTPGSSTGATGTSDASRRYRPSKKANCWSRMTPRGTQLPLPVTENEATLQLTQ